MTAAFVGCTPHPSWGSQLPLLLAHTSAKTSGVTFPSCMGFCSLLHPGWTGPEATLGKAGGLAAAQLPWTATLGNGRQ